MATSECESFNTCGACKEKCIATHYKSPLNLNSYSFYRLMVGDFFSCLQVPSDFTNQTQCQACGLASLEGPSGHLWHAKLCCHKSSVYFKDGWKNFISDHSVEAEDILVFRHVFNTHFLVQIFGPTGCEKHSSLTLQHYTTCCFGEGNMPRVCNLKICEHMKPSTEEFVSLENSLAVDKKRKKDTVVKSLTANTKEYPSSFDTEIEKMPARTYLTNDRDANSFKGLYPETYETYCSSAAPPSIADYVPTHASKGDNTAKFSKSGHFISEKQVGLSKEHSITKDAKEEANTQSLSVYKHDSTMDESFIRSAFEVQETLSFCGSNVTSINQTTVSCLPLIQSLTSVGAEKAEFRVVMTKSAVSENFRLNVSKKTAKHWFPKDHTEVFLSDCLNAGKGYAMTFRHYSHFRGFSSKWKKVAHANNLEERDICVFKLASKEFYIFNVYVVKAVKKDILSLNNKGAAKVNALEKFISPSCAQHYLVKHVGHVSEGDLAGNGICGQTNTEEEVSAEQGRKYRERTRDLSLDTRNDAFTPLWEQKLIADSMEYQMKHVNKSRESMAHARCGSFPIIDPKQKILSMQRTEQIDRKRKKMSKNIESTLRYQGAIMRGAIKCPVPIDNDDRCPKLVWTRAGIVRNGQSHVSHKRTGVEVIELD